MEATGNINLSLRLVQLFKNINKLMESYSSNLCFVTLLWLLLLIQLHNYASLGCLEEERVELLRLKDSFKNPAGYYLPSWGGEDRDCCRWESVKCDNSTKRVIELSLNSKSGYELRNWSLNASLFHPFQELQVLSLGGNCLAGFHEMLRLNKLQVLDLGLNWFTELPSLRALPSLKYLDLSLNRVNNLNHFQELTTSRNLEVLNLCYNAITGEIPPSVADLTSLKALSFGSNELNGSWPVEGFCKLKNLEEFDVSSSGLEGKLHPCLNNLTSLRLLELSENNFRGTIPSSFFGSLKSLEYVSLSENHFEGFFSLSSLANNSKLEVFELESYNNHLRIETENPRWFPPFQLKIFRLTNCTINEPSAKMPSFLRHQYDLSVIDLGDNNMTGKFPSWLLANNTKLEYLSLRDNSLTSILDFHPDSYNIHLRWLDASYNFIHGQLPSYIGFVFPSLYSLNVSQNMLEGNIPPSMGDMRMLHALDLSNNNFSGEVPEQLTMGCKSLSILRLSHNNFHDQILHNNSNLTELWYLYLDNNNFTGELLPGLLNTNLLFLDISNNDVSGNIPSWIGNFSRLRSLVLSKNSLEGPFPLGFCKLNTLRFVDLSQNNIGPTIPPCANLSSLKYLHLHKNDFRETIPSVISKASSLITLDMRDNKLSGEIPSWIASLLNLRILLLKGNSLGGSVLIHLCQLRNISILDLSQNHFSGSIPSCLSDITFGRGRTLDDTFLTEWLGEGLYGGLSTYSYESQLEVSLNYAEIFRLSEEKEEVIFLSKSRSEIYMGNVLYFISGMDLSCNNLTGSVPSEIGYLSWIHTLNLSYNQFTGSIPKTFSSLRQIQSLDLSHNRLSGLLNSLPAFVTDADNKAEDYLETRGRRYARVTGKLKSAVTFAT
ncbi:receptor-like protein 9a [Actinidia eriantha]|uniref:receptor-like protein 9a n=1 Tax=Actinidia eriantha TaxID=165200 RepID=UPI00258FEB6B|nr:receptor-like protein 9a [Actinidia eriantha]